MLPSVYCDSDFRLVCSYIWRRSWRYHKRWVAQIECHERRELIRYVVTNAITGRTDSHCRGERQHWNSWIDHVSLARKGPAQDCEAWIQRAESRDWNGCGVERNLGNCIFREYATINVDKTRGSSDQCELIRGLSEFRRSWSNFTSPSLTACHNETLLIWKGLRVKARSISNKVHLSIWERNVRDNISISHSQGRRSKRWIIVS